jgi:division protein CdvB (Snf7/Vps24/ESCRT-III family)
MFRERVSWKDRVKNVVSPKPMRQRLVETTHKLQMQLHRLERASADVEARDKFLYDKCINAVKHNDVARAKIYAEECAQIRKVAKITLNSQFALERVVLRLEVVKESGDLAHNMSALKGVVGTIRTDLSNIMPEISLKLAEVDDSLSSMVLDIGEATGSFSSGNVPTEEGGKILAEAAALAEQQVKDRFPELPAASTEGAVSKPL